MSVETLSTVELLGALAGAAASKDIGSCVATATELGRRIERGQLGGVDASSLLSIDGPRVRAIAAVEDAEVVPAQRRPRRVDAGRDTTRAVRQTRPGPNWKGAMPPMPPDLEDDE